MNSYEKEKKIQEEKRQHFSIRTKSHFKQVAYYNAYYSHIGCLLVNIKHIFCVTIFYIPNSTQYLNLTTILLY